MAQKTLLWSEDHLKPYHFTAHKIKTCTVVFLKCSTGMRADGRNRLCSLHVSAGVTEHVPILNGLWLDFSWHEYVHRSAITLPSLSLSSPVPSPSGMLPPLSRKKADCSVSFTLLRVTDCNMPSHQNLHDSKTLKEAGEIVADRSHLRHKLFENPLSGKTLWSI